DPPRLADVTVSAEERAAALDATVVIKLNGGLGTSMGMDRAKSLLPVRGGKTFLDMIVGQVRAARIATGARLPLLFMNSFRTRDDTLAALGAYEDLPVPGVPLDFLQNSEPKLLVDDLTPVSWPDDPSLEWWPPGHGDIYTAMEDSGVLDILLEKGFSYASGWDWGILVAVPSTRTSTLRWSPQVCWTSCWRRGSAMPRCRTRTTSALPRAGRSRGGSPPAAPRTRPSCAAVPRMTERAATLRSASPTAG